MTSAARISNEVGDVAALVSLSLALLTFFTTRRAERLRRDLERGAGDVGKRALADLAADAALAAATIVVLWLLEPLFADAFDTSRLGDRDWTAPSLFAVVYLGFAVLLLVQAALVAQRFRVPVRNQVAAWRARRGG